MPGRNGQIILFAAQGTAGKISKVWRGGNFHWLTQAFFQAGAQRLVLLVKSGARWYGARRRPKTVITGIAKHAAPSSHAIAYSQRMHHDRPCALLNSPSFSVRPYLAQRRQLLRIVTAYAGATRERWRGTPVLPSLSGSIGTSTPYCYRSYAGSQAVKSRFCRVDDGNKSCKRHYQETNMLTTLISPSNHQPHSFSVAHKTQRSVSGWTRAGR